MLIYTPPAGRAAGQAHELGRAFEQAVRESGAEVIESPLERIREVRAARLARESQLGFLARGRALVEAGRRALARVELERAETALAEAELVYGAELAWPGVASLLGQAALERGVALFELGREAEARRAFRRAVTFEPTLALTEARVRPDVARAFVQAMAARPRRRLRVNVDGGAEISVDGRVAGRAPLELEVEEGEHLVEASALGRETKAGIFEVPSANLDVELTLPLDQEVVAAAALGAAPTAAGLRALAHLLDLDAVMVVGAGLDRGQLTLAAQRFSPRAGLTTVEIEVASDNLQSAATGLARRLASAATSETTRLAVLEAAPLSQPRPLDLSSQPNSRRRHFYERPWLWAAVLATTTAVVATAVALSGSAPSYQVRVDGTVFSGR